MTWLEMQALVPEPGGHADWAAWVDAIPALQALEATVQDPVHHAEGPVGLHTRMVLQALLDDAHWRAAPRERQVQMFMAALLHDIAKPQTTVIDEATGRVSQPGHSRRGSVDARVLLWRAGMPFACREAVCRMIAVHQVPFFAFDSRRGEAAEAIARKLSWQLRVDDLTCIARADMVGRICATQRDHLDDIALFEELAREQGCWDRPWPAADAHTRLMYARGMAIDPSWPLHREPGSQVVVMSGLPASGKDTWVAAERPQQPVVSFDDARSELGLKHGQNDGLAAHHAVDKARALLRRKAPFVWNATHLSVQMRGKTLDLLYAYGAEVRIVYLESSCGEVFGRNRRRDTTLSNEALERMLHRWEVPLPSEAHAVDYLLDGG